jgi:hypothetical protein
MGDPPMNFFFQVAWASRPCFLEDLTSTPTFFWTVGFHPDLFSWRVSLPTEVRQFVAPALPVRRQTRTYKKRSHTDTLNHTSSTSRSPQQIM